MNEPNESPTIDDYKGNVMDFLYQKEDQVRRIMAAFNAVTELNCKTVMEVEKAAWVFVNTKEKVMKISVWKKFVTRLMEVLWIR